MYSELDKQEEVVEQVELAEAVKLVCLIGLPSGATESAKQGATDDVKPGATESAEQGATEGADQGAMAGATKVCQSEAVPQPAPKQAQAAAPKREAEWEVSNWMPDYEVLEKLGNGSLTSVYKVRRRGIDEVFAAKVLRSQFGDNPRTTKRFMQEAQKAASLNNAHLVSVYEVGKTSTEEPFLICDWVTGGSLAERLAGSGRLAQEAVLDLFLQVCEGLNQAHKKGVIHRDIKPGNVVFKKDGDGELVKLADFGIAKVLPSVGRETKYFTPEGEAFGNPTYMSPEQIKGARLDARADIYALGCVMYECICGEPPFTGSNCVKVALAQIQEEPKPLRRRAMGVKLSLGMEVLVMRMIAKDADDRYQTVEELIADLKLVRAGGTPKPPPLRVVPDKPNAPPCAEQKLAQVLGKDARAVGSMRFDGKLAGHAMEQSEHALPAVKAPKSEKPSNNFGADFLEFLEAIQIEFLEGKRALIALWSLKNLCVIGTFLILGTVVAYFVVQKLSGGHNPWDYNRVGYEGGFRPASGPTSLPKYYSLTAPASLTDFEQPFLPNNQALRDIHNRVVFYYTHRYLKVALQHAVANHENLALANLEGQRLTDMYLAGARLAGADLRGCDFSSTNLVGADLMGADLTDARLVNCDLSKAHLDDAKLTNARLDGANLRHSALKGADLTGTQVSPEMLDGDASFYREPTADRTPDVDPPQ